MPPIGALIVIDMEFTSWPGTVDRMWQGENEFPEIVQIGAVMADLRKDYSERASFSCYVKPVRHPVLSDYFTNLTGITQECVDSKGIPFPEAFARFMEFVGAGKVTMCCNGLDIDFLQKNCELHGLGFPPVTHDIETVELHHFFEKLFPNPAGKPPPSWSLPELAGLPQAGRRAHDALDDSRAILAALGELAAKGISPFAD